MFVPTPIAQALAACLALAAAAPSAPADTPPALRALLVRWRCPIFDRLVRIHDAGDPASGHNRYIAIEVPGSRYVQCKFHDRVRRLYCEAASGFYEAAPGAPRTAHLPATAIAGLARLGFSTDDRAGNFTLDVEVGEKPDYRALADLILAALYVGYGAQASMELRIAAPFAPLPGSTCDATS